MNLRKEIQRQNIDIDAIKFIISHMIPKHEFSHLEKLASDKEFLIDIEYYPDHIQRQMRHLQDLGFIENMPEQSIYKMYKDQVDTRTFGIIAA